MILPMIPIVEDVKMPPHGAVLVSYRSVVYLTKLDLVPPLDVSEAELAQMRKAIMQRIECDLARLYFGR